MHTYRSITKPTTFNRFLFRTLALFVVLGPLVGVFLAIMSLWQRAVDGSDLILLAIAYPLGMLGMGIGYHRMLSHRSFRPHPVVKFIFLVLGSMSAQGPALEWAATHIKHHAHADREGDPHSPVEGLFHAHVGWIFKGGMANPNEYCPYLIQDKMVLFVSHTFFLWVALGLFIPFEVGGWSGLIWSGLVRMFLVNHVFWSINSLGHSFGMREFETNDQSHNDWLMVIMGLGEGWHNNHHAFPRSAFMSRYWWQFDPAGYLIWTLERLGLACDVHGMSPSLLERYDARKAEMANSIPLGGHK